MPLHFTTKCFQVVREDAGGSSFFAGRVPHLPHDHLNIPGCVWLHVGTVNQLRLRVHDLPHHVRRLLSRLLSAHHTALYFISRR